jgi:hypothetical protein
MRSLEVLCPTRDTFASTAAMAITPFGLRSAAARHLADADGHFQNGNLEQAAHLAGFAPECARKAMLDHRWHKRLGHRMDGPVLELLASLEPRSVCETPLDRDGERELRAWTPEVRYAGSGTLRREAVAELVATAKRVAVHYLAQGWALGR